MWNAVILWFIVRNIYIWFSSLFLTQGSWHPCKFLSDKSTRRIFCSTEATDGVLLYGFGMGTGHQKDQAMIRSLKFSAPAPILQRWERAGNEVNNWPCLHEKAPIKYQKYWFQRASRLVNTSMYQEGDTSATPWRQKLLCSGPSQTSPYVSLFICILYHIF